MVEDSAVAAEEPVITKDDGLGRAAWMKLAVRRWKKNALTFVVESEASESERSRRQTSECDPDPDPELAVAQWTKCQERVSLIPFCGGCLVPTVSNEETCLRHFSNENTMFRPFGIYFIRKYAEHSRFIRRCGAVGCGFATRHRAAIMLFAFFCSFSGWLCMFASALGLSRNGDVIRQFGWANINWKDDDGTGVRLFIGINVRVIEYVGLGTNSSGGMFRQPGKVVASLRQWGNGACSDLAVTGLDTVTVDVLDFCESCESTAQRTNYFIWMGILTQILQITTNLQRLTPYGDMNCQKTMGWITSLIQLGTGASSLFSFLEGCWKHHPRTISLAINGTLSTSGTQTSIGLGSILMTVAVFLKTIDALCHLAVQTPEAKRKATFGPITLQEYCARCNEPTRLGQPISLEAKTQDVRIDNIPAPKSSSTHDEARNDGGQRKTLQEDVAPAKDEAASKDRCEERDQTAQHRRRRRKSSRRSLDSLQAQHGDAQRGEQGGAQSFVW